MTENQQSPSSTFYAVAWGNQRGVFTNWKDAQSALKGFPSPVYKKFSDRNQADEFLKKSQPESTSIEADENWAGNFYVVARGRVLGIFKDFDTVKKNIAGFPKPMHKKFTTFVEAKQYFEKFAEGKVEEKTPKRKATHEEDKEENEVEGKGNDVNDVKPVARKRTSGKVGETDESDTGEQLDQMTEETNKEAKITHQSEEAIETGASSFEEEKPVKSQDDQYKDERKEAEDTGTAIAEDYEPSQKHPKTEE